MQADASTEVQALLGAAMSNNGAKQHHGEICLSTISELSLLNCHHLSVRDDELRAYIGTVCECSHCGTASVSLVILHTIGGLLQAPTQIWRSS